MPARAPSTHIGATAGSAGRTVWGEPSQTAVTSEQTGGAFTLTALDLPAGWHRDAYVHHRYDECFVVRSGWVVFHIEDHDGPIVAGPGDTVYVPRGLVRSAALAGGRAASVLLLQTPAPIDIPAPAPAPADARWLDGVELVNTPRL